MLRRTFRGVVRLGLLVLFSVFAEWMNLWLACILQPPLRLLYLSGLIWESRKEATICGALTGTDADWWDANPHCALLVTHRVHALAISLSVGIWAILFLFLVLQVVRLPDELLPASPTTPPRR